MLLSLAGGCGGPKPATDATTPPPAPAAPAAPVPEPSAAATPSAPEAAPVASAPVEAPSAPEPVTPVADRLFAPSVAFMIRYEDSSPKQAADATCAKSGDDPDARSKCMEKERSRFLADVLVFKQSDKGSFFTIYRRQGNALQELSKSTVEEGDKTPERIVLKVKSDKGSRVIFTGKKEISVRASSDSTSMIELDDPRFGKLVYEARIGLVND